jgi:MFS superfamily sulfate permease-like transporter
LVEIYHDKAMESKMRRFFWPADHPAALLALAATAILVFAWPLENVPACVLAAVMIVVAAGITIRGHFHSARMGQ